jgi:mono/diheme cytochrome c family protein
MRKLYLLLVPFAYLSAAQPSVSADAARGEQLARRWCASCHLVTPDQAKATPDAPSFSAIARKSDFSAKALAFLLLGPHPIMPELALRRGEAEDIAAYIGRLRSAPNKPVTK